MARSNAATRSDLHVQMNQGINSQRKVIDHESTHLGEVNQKGRGIVIRPVVRSVAVRRNAGPRVPS